MEPVAPGTEDEFSTNLPAISKQASEQERLLSQKAYLPNGSYGSVFELSYQNGCEHWYCNLCECPVMGRVYHHEIGKRHTHNMSAPGAVVATHTIAAEPTMYIAPGEPVPPGFEGEIEKTAQIQERLENYTVGALIGLEYLFEIQEYDRDKEPAYLCMLCDKKGDPRTVIAHLASYNHINQYVQKHFPTCYRALSPYSTKQYKRNWQNTMQKIAEAVEHKFGRLKPHPVEFESFEQKRLQYLQMVVNGPHFTEKSGCTFEELVSKEELTKNLEDQTISKPSEEVGKRFYRKTGSEPGTGDPNVNKKRSPSPPVVARPVKKTKPVSSTETKRRSLSSVSSISSSDLSDFEPDKPRKSPGRSKYRNKSPYRGRGTRRPERKSPSRRRTDRREHKLPWQKSDYIRSRSDIASDSKLSKLKTDKLDEYKKLATAIENDMAKTLKQHEKNPEKHPQYNDEWKKFWNRRYKELQAEGKDASKHDFKPEWILFWNKRMVELHNDEVKVKKEALRKRLGLPEEPAPICFRITGKKKPSPKEKQSTDNKPKPIASAPDVDPEVIVIDDKDEDKHARNRSHSPWENESPVKRTRISRDRSRERERSREKILRSRDIDFRNSELRNRDRDLDRSRNRDIRSRDRDVRSRDRDSRSRDRDFRSRERDFRNRDQDFKSRDRATRSRDRSRERDKRDRDIDFRGRDIRSRDRDYIRETSWERESMFRDVYRRDVLDIYKPPRIMRDVTRQPVLSPPVSAQEEEVDDGEVNVVGVLRLLTALEEKLGSLGPKIIDMLAQALAMEKNEANSSETLLDSDINVVLFETVKEKLKGQLLAGLVEYAQEKAFKNAIKKIASLVHFAGERKKASEKKPDPVKVPGVGTVDKEAIAKQIAVALVLQGKTDVTQAELEQLINAVVGMAEASRGSNKPMTTASFLQQMTAVQQQKVSSTEPKREPMSDALQALQGNDSSSMEGLSDSDLQTLLQNFKDLSTTEQHGLITYLKKLESKEPERVERLRKFVSLGPETDKGEEKKESGKLSPFSNRQGDLNPMGEEKNSINIDEEEPEEQTDENKEKPDKPVAKVSLDSDEEEYSFEDVFKAAEKNVTEKEEKEQLLEKNKKDTDFDLKDAKAIIANLMGSFSAKNSSNPSLLSLPSQSQIRTPTTSETAQLNMDKLVGNIQSLLEPTRNLSAYNTNTSIQNIIPSLQNMNAQEISPNIPFRTQSSIDGLGSGMQPRPSAPYVGQNVQYPVKTAAMPSFGNSYRPNVDNYGQNVGYPQQNVQYPMSSRGIGYNNSPNPNYNLLDQDRYGNRGRNSNPNQYNNRQSSGNNYGNRW